MSGDPLNITESSHQGQGRKFWDKWLFSDITSGTKYVIIVSNNSVNSDIIYLMLASEPTSYRDPSPSASAATKEVSS